MPVPAGQPEGVLSWGAGGLDSAMVHCEIRTTAMESSGQRATLNGQASSGDAFHTGDNTPGHFKHFHSGVRQSVEQGSRPSEALP